MSNDDIIVQNTSLRVRREIDDWPINPRDNDCLGRLNLYMRNYNLAQEDPKDPEELAAIVQNGGIVLPVRGYSHSGVHFTADPAIAKGHPFNDQFDSGAAGYIYVTAEQIHDEYGNSPKGRELATQVMIAEVLEYGQYVNGENYKFVLDRKELLADPKRKTYSHWVPQENTSTMLGDDPKHEAYAISAITTLEERQLLGALTDYDCALLHIKEDLAQKRDSLEKSIAISLAHPDPFFAEPYSAFLNELLTTAKRIQESADLSVSGAFDVLAYHEVIEETNTTQGIPADPFADGFDPYSDNFKARVTAVRNQYLSQGAIVAKETNTKIRIQNAEEIKLQNLPEMRLVSENSR